MAGQPMQYNLCKLRPFFVEDLNARETIGEKMVDIPKSSSKNKGIGNQDQLKQEGDRSLFQRLE